MVYYIRDMFFYKRCVDAREFDYEMLLELLEYYPISLLPPCPPLYF